MNPIRQPSTARTLLSSVVEIFGSPSVRPFSRAMLPALVAAFLPCLAATATAETHAQTDWSGGPTAQSPVMEWSDTFAGATQTSWRSVPGQLAISSQPVTPTGGVITDQAPACRSVAAGDLDGDGDLDLMTALALTSFPGTGKVRWYENAGDGVSWTEHEVDDDFYGGWGITNGDIDGDGDLDIVASAFYGEDQRNGRYVWYENVDGHAGVWAKHPIAGYLWGTQMAAVADIDGDGDLDVYGCSTLTHIGNFNDDIYWFDNAAGDGSVWVQRTIDDNYDDAIDACAADLDGDGDLDMVCTSYGLLDINWWENLDGGGIGWVKHPIAAQVVTDNTVAVGDIDGDGRLDVVASGVQSTVAVWFRNPGGSGGGWPGYLVGYINNCEDVGLADLDGDGLLDVLASGISEVHWYHNAGGGVFSPHLITYIYREGQSAVGADINGDGALEVVYTESGMYAGDVSGLFRESITSFAAGGELESAVLDAGAPRDWTTIDWEATVPPSTQLTFQVRGSDDPDNLGPWSGDITSPGSLAGIVAPNTRFIQYKVIQSTMNPDASPIVREVSLSEAGSSSVPGEDAERRPASGRLPILALRPPWPNPTSGGGATASFLLQKPGAVRIDILDARGRRVGTPLLESLGSGEHEARLPDLPSGVFLIRLTSQGASAARKLVVR